MDYFIERLKEASTWRGMVWMLAAVGVHFSPEQTGAILALGAAIAGAIGVFLPNKVAVEKTVKDVG